MSDMGDIFKAMKEDSKNRKHKNLVYSTNLLASLNVEFEVKNCANHLIVNHFGKVADFWPSTGKFNIRGEKDYHRGVNNLLNKLGIKK